ncbi:glycosyltransferase family 2 protein, partial [Escherichia coli]
MKNPKITVFTPTYNRSYILDNLYQSLKNQTCYDFEWLIIDDGSTDDTEILIKKWISEETLFNIKYHKKQNGGKHRAINIGVELAKGKLFFIVDSDDKVLPDSVEKIIDWESKLPRKEKFAGVAGNRAYSNDQVIGKTFTGDFIDATSLERERFNIMGDKAEAFYTDIL